MPCFCWKWHSISVGSAMACWWVPWCTTRLPSYIEDVWYGSVFTVLRYVMNGSENHSATEHSTDHPPYIHGHLWPMNISHHAEHFQLAFSLIVSKTPLTELFGCQWRFSVYVVRCETWHLWTLCCWNRWKQPVPPPASEMAELHRCVYCTATGVMCFRKLQLCRNSGVHTGHSDIFTTNVA